MSWRSHAIYLFNDRVRMDYPRFFELSIKYGEWSRGDVELVGHPTSQSITTGRENHDGVAFPQFAHILVVVSAYVLTMVLMFFFFW